MMLCIYLWCRVEVEAPKIQNLCFSWWWESIIIATIELKNAAARLLVDAPASNNPTSNGTQIYVFAVHIFGVLGSTWEYSRVIRSICEYSGSTFQYSQFTPWVLRSTPGTPEYFGVLRSPAPKRLQNTTKVYKQTTWLCGRPLGIIVSNISEWVVSYWS